MKWTKEKPTKEGYYWACDPTLYDPMIVRIERFGEGGLFVEFPGSEGDYLNREKIWDNEYWYGPIEVPEFKEDV
jgi:hypothetical protein